MAVQLRRENYADFDPQKMKPAEVAVVQEDDPTSHDGKAVYVAISPGDVKRIAVLDELQDAVYNQIDTAISTATQATIGNAEAWAVGNRGGSAVPSTDPAYHNNSKYYAEQAAESARTLTIDSTLTQLGQAADAKVVGDRNGDLKADLKVFESDSEVYKNVYSPTSFENGQIDISNYALVYSESNLICRLPENSFVLTTPNTVIRLTDKTNYDMRFKYSGTDGKWYGSSWQTDDAVLTATQNRKYIIEIKRKKWGAITPSDCNGLVEFIFPYTKTERDGLAFYKSIDLQSVLKYGGMFFDVGNGLPSGSTTSKVSPYIPVKQGQTLYYDLSAGSASGRYIIVFYDSDYAFVSGVEGIGTGQYTIQSDGYIRISNLNSYTNGYAYFDYPIPDKTRLAINSINRELDDFVTGTDYMRSAIDKITGELKAKSALGNIVTFGFSTDQHIKDDDDAKYTLPVLRGLQALSKLTQAYPYDFVCLGGDACEAGAYAITPELILDECVTIQKPLHDAWCPVVPLTGNHDAAQNNANITGEMLFNAHFKRIANSGFLKGWDNSHTNGYWDSEAHKIRFIFFDDTLRTDYTYAQRSAALSEMLSGTPNDYKIVIFSHHVISSAITNPKWANPLGLQSIINPYANRIICCICGHSHIDISETSDGILYIATTLAMYGYDQDNNRGTLNTETETAFDTFVIDQQNQHIYALRYGHGSNRDWSYTLT